MDRDTIINYVLNTPENTNPAVLDGMLKALESGGGRANGLVVLHPVCEWVSSPGGAKCTFVESTEEIRELMRNNIVMFLVRFTHRAFEGNTTFTFYGSLSEAEEYSEEDEEMMDIKVSTSTELFNGGELDAVPGEPVTCVLAMQD